MSRIVGKTSQCGTYFIRGEGLQSSVMAQSVVEAGAMERDDMTDPSVDVIECD